MKYIVAALVALSFVGTASASSEPRCWYAVKCIQNGEQLNDSKTADGSAKSSGETDAQYAERMAHFEPFDDHY